MNNRLLQPQLKASFFLPKYWPTWLGVAILYLLSWLPYRLQILLGKAIGQLLYRIDFSRIKVARKNLALCYPNKSDAERESILKKNIENTAIAIFETGMAWWWPNWRVNRKFSLEGAEHLAQAQQNGRGVLLLTIHNLSLEMSGRGMGLSHYPTVCFYRPNGNALAEFFQYHGRNRASRYMLDKRNVRGLIKALKTQEICIYAPDQDYGRHNTAFIPFFGVEASTTKGSLTFAKLKNVDVILMSPIRNEHGGYTVVLSPAWQNFPTGDQVADLSRINQEIEQAINAHPEQYMWVHKRFKTRPDASEPSLYS